MISNKNKLIFFFYICFFASCQPSDTSNQQAPNIILFFCDDLGYGDLGITGHPTIQTPHIDHMATTGLRMPQFYSASPACTASRYGLLTGKYPVRSGFSWVLFPQSSKGIHPEEKTIAETLQANGYKTACYGKWHLGSTKKAFFPTQNGFDDYLGLPYSNDMIPPIHPDIALLHNEDTLALNPDQSKLTKLYTEKAVEFIQKNQKHPFFLYLPYAMPHLPLHPGEDFQGKSLRGKYGDVVEEIDWSVGRVNKVLDSLGLSANTLVIFTSDNGPWIIKDEEGGSSGLFRDGKGSTWEGGMRVPAIFKWPQQIPAASVSTQVAGTIDLYNTLEQVSGQKQLSKTDGQSLFPYWQKPTHTRDRLFFYYGPGKKPHAIRKGKWKLHVKTSSQTRKKYFDKIPLLFDLEVDPSEQYDLSEQFPDTLALLQQLLQAHEAEVAQTSNYYAKERAALFQSHIAINNPISLQPAYHKYGEEKVITDGSPGDLDDLNSFYAAEDKRLQIIIDLESFQKIDSIQVSFLQKHQSWIFLPEHVQLSLSLDGKDYKEIDTQSITPAIEYQKDKIQLLKFQMPKIKSRFIKVEATSEGVCPAWHPGAGQPSWIMMDEVYVF